MDKDNILFILYKNNELNEINNFLFTKDNIRKIIFNDSENIKYIPLEYLKDEDFFIELFNIDFNFSKRNIDSNLIFFINKMSISMINNYKFLLKLIKINHYIFRKLVECNHITKKNSYKNN